MKKLILLFLILCEVIMGSEVLKVDVNGTAVPLVFEQDNRLPIVTMQVVFENAGSISNTKIAGLSRSVAKMYGEGTKTLGSIAFAKKLDAKAIHISANSGTETFVFELSCLKEHFSEGVKALTSLLNNQMLVKKL